MTKPTRNQLFTVFNGLRKRTGTAGNSLLDQFLADLELKRKLRRGGGAEESQVQTGKLTREKKRGQTVSSGRVESESGAE